MSIAAGLVGLPNVGKSTLFNALTKSSVPAENYPFCTIDPHKACTVVPDVRCEKLKKAYGSEKIIPTSVTFVDIAGLVKGAASGEGLGNQFLSHIRETSLILHVVRCFEDPDITATRGTVDPLGDFEIITTELMLKDLESVAKRKIKVEQLLKAARANLQQLRELEKERELVNKLEKALNENDGDSVRALTQELGAFGADYLSGKKFLIIANLSESEISGDYVKNPHYQALIKKFGAERVIPVSAKLEAELSLLSHEEALEMAAMMGLESRGIDRIITAAYKALGLITFFTCGPKEIHAWTVPAGVTIKTAAGEIHSDLERGFICAEVFSADDIIALGSESRLKEQGKMRTEGQTYLIQDGDIINVRFSV